MIPALDAAALLAKSQLYVRKALAAKAREDLEEYQLWSALALELLGKHALASKHPSLIVDATNPNNVLVAAGIPVQTTVRTITAEETFSRLRHLTRRFAGCFEYCKRIAARRNAELHSGEAAFTGMLLPAWEAEFWHASEAILEVVGLELDDWLGANQAQAPKETVRAATEARKQAAREKVRHAKEAFDSLPSKDRSRLLENARLVDRSSVTKKFRRLVDHEWETTCPACGSRAFVGGDKYQEYSSEERHPEPGWEEVDIEYEAEEFVCPSCGLHVDGQISLAAAGIETSHVESEEREIEYEPEYGNC